MMAVVFTRDEVLEELFRDEDKQMPEDGDVLNEEDQEREGLREFLHRYVVEKENFDRQFFVEKSVEVLLPIVSQACDLQSDGKLFDY